jgi:phosphopantetheinyl transferase (holo-ACP synthase)
VDLLHPHALGKSKNIRFRKRVYLPEEEDLILTDKAPDAMLWSLWAGKEAAYKAIQKDQRDISSSPRLYHVQYDRTEEVEQDVRRLCGSVATPRGNILLETLITVGYVHSIATSFAPASDARIVWQVERLPFETPSPADESAYVRAIAQRHLAQYLPGSSPMDIEIRRTPGPHGLGPPLVFFQGQETAIDISLSHEGAFAAYAFAIFS